MLLHVENKVDYGHVDIADFVNMKNLLVRTIPGLMKDSAGNRQ